MLNLVILGAWFKNCSKLYHPEGGKKSTAFNSDPEGWIEFFKLDSFGPACAGFSLELQRDGSSTL